MGVKHLMHQVVWPPDPTCCHQYKSWPRSGNNLHHRVQRPVNPPWSSTHTRQNHGVLLHASCLPSTSTLFRQTKQAWLSSMWSKRLTEPAGKIFNECDNAMNLANISITKTAPYTTSETHAYIWLFFEVYMWDRALTLIMQCPIVMDV